MHHHWINRTTEPLGDPLAVIHPCPGQGSWLHLGRRVAKPLASPLITSVLPHTSNSIMVQCWESDSTFTILFGVAKLNCTKGSFSSLGGGLWSPECFYCSLQRVFQLSTSVCCMLWIVHDIGQHPPRWLRWLRHSAHRPGRSIGGAGVQFSGSAGRFRVRISGVHALRLISRAGKEGSTVSSIICDRGLILG